MQAELDFTSIPPERREGMQAALDHAEKEAPDWGDLAFQFLSNYARANPQVFAEDVTKAAEAWNLVQPPTTRAWGGVYVRAQHAQIIEATKETRRRANGSLATVYRSLLYKSAA